MNKTESEMTQMASIYVSTQAQLLSALSSAKGGETIILKSGDYGSIDIISESFSSYVTIKSEVPQGAKFADIGIQESNFLRIDGVHVDNPGNGGYGSHLVSVTDSSHIEFINSEVNGKVDGDYTGHDALYTKNVSDVVFADNYIHDVRRGGVFYSADDLEVSENKIEYIGDTDLKFIDVHGVLIENNIGARYVYPEKGAHLDMIQFLGSDSSDIIIRGNVLLPGNWGNVQGIFLDDASYKNVLIEQNIIYTGMIRGISVTAGSNIVVRNNTVLDIEGSGSKATKIMLPGGSSSYDNIQASYLQDAGQEGSVVTLQQADPNSAYYYDDFFVNARVGKGITLEDLRPVQGSLAETIGAHDRLMELLDGASGTDDYQPVPAPEETPVPAPEEPPASNDDSAQSTPFGEAVYARSGSHNISSASDVIEVAPSAVWKLPSATLALTFNADTVAGIHGILSKDASDFTGGGNHFTSYIKEGTLYVRFQDGSNSETFTAQGIKADTDYDLQVSFGDGKVSVWLDGETVGSAAFDMSWEGNNEYLQIGANGWGSSTGKSGFTHVFDGTISDVVVVEGRKSPADMAAMVGGEATPEPDLDELPVPISHDLPNPVFSLDGDIEFSGDNGDFINLEHQSNLELSEGTIAFSFDADSVNDKAGLISKDASYFTGGGNHFSAWINDGKLYVRFQDEDSSAKFNKNIEANEEYDIQATFNEDTVGVYVNGTLIGSKNLTMDWTANEEFLQVGGLGWASDSGDDKAGHAFDGTISDVAIFDHEFTPQDYDFFA